MYKYFSKYLSDEEVILRVIYQAKFFLILRLFFLLILFLLNFFLMFPLFGLGDLGILFFILMILFCFFSAIKFYRQYLFNALVITDQSIHSFYHDGILERVVEEFDIANVQKIKIFYENWFKRILKIGNLSIFLINENELIFENIFQVKKIQRYIQELIS